MNSLISGMNIMILIYIIVVICLFFIGLWNLKRYRIINNTPISKIADIREGLAAVEGRVVALNEAIQSPLSGVRCVYYKFIVKREKSGHKGTRWIKEIKDIKHVPFYVNDGTGIAEIELRKAKLFSDTIGVSSGFFNPAPPQLEKTLNERYGYSSEGIIFNKLLCYIEKVLKENDNIYVIGYVINRQDLPYRFVKDKFPFIISNRSKDWLLDHYLVSVLFSWAPCITLIIGGIIFTIKG